MSVLTYSIRLKFKVLEFTQDKIRTITHDRAHLIQLILVLIQVVYLFLSASDEQGYGMILFSFAWWVIFAMSVLFLWLSKNFRKAALFSITWISFQFALYLVCQITHLYHRDSIETFLEKHWSEMTFSALLEVNKNRDELTIRLKANPQLPTHLLTHGIPPNDPMNNRLINKSETNSPEFKEVREILFVSNNIPPLYTYRSSSGDLRQILKQDRSQLMNSGWIVPIQELRKPQKGDWGMIFLIGSEANPIPIMLRLFGVSLPLFPSEKIRRVVFVPINESILQFIRQSLQ